MIIVTDYQPSMHHKYMVIIVGGEGVHSCCHAEKEGWITEKIRFLVMLKISGYDSVMLSND